VLVSENPRARRLADRIKVIVAGLLEAKIKDPRLGFVTITDVRVTGDLQQASVFYTVYGDDDAHVATAAALNSAKGMVRSVVGRQVALPLTPRVEFHLDTVPETSAHLASALDEAKRRDAELAALREGKAYAGDSDPYRKADDDMTDTLADKMPDEWGFAGFDDGEHEGIETKPAVLPKSDDASGFSGYDDEK
jgi:ribosome-binding factor A